MPTSESFEPAKKVPEGVLCEAFLDGKRVKNVIVKREGNFLVNERLPQKGRRLHVDSLPRGYMLRPLLLRSLPT